MIPADLFSFAYIPAWFEQLYELSQLAAPEPWRYICPEYETQNNETPILERYINQIFMFPYRPVHAAVQGHLHVLRQE